MRTLIGAVVTIVTIAAGCSSSPNAGPLGEGMGGTQTIVAVDSGRPPRSIAAQLAQPAYVAVLLVAPGHSATLVYPRDSTTSNRFDAGTVTLPIEIPSILIRSDSALIRQRRAQAARQDSILRARARGQASRNPPMLGPLPPNTPTYLLLVTSPHPLVYDRIIDRTAGVSIPVIESEALNAVGKAVRSTLPEPRTIGAYYQLVELSRP